MAIDPDKLDLADGQYEMFDDLVTSIAQSTGLEKTILRGFFWRSIKKWQHQSGVSIGDIANLTPPDRVERALEVVGYFRHLVLDKLENEAQCQAFRTSLEDTFERYRRSYGKR